MQNIPRFLWWKVATQIVGKIKQSPNDILKMASKTKLWYLFVTCRHNLAMTVRNISQLLFVFWTLTAHLFEVFEILIKNKQVTELFLTKLKVSC